MSKKRYLTGGLLGLAALGACIGGAIAASVQSIPKKVAVEMVNNTTGLPTNATFAIIPQNAISEALQKIILTLTNGNFTFSSSFSDKVQLCAGTILVAENDTVSGLNNNTLVLTIKGSATSGQSLMLKKDNGTHNCTDTLASVINFIKILPTVNAGDKVTISGNILGSEIISEGTLLEIVQQTSAALEKIGKSTIDYSKDLKEFADGKSSNATLYIKNATLDIYAANGNFSIEVAGDMSGVANGNWTDGNKYCNLNLDPPTSPNKLKNDACPMSNVTSTNTKLTININGTVPLSERKFYTTVNTVADNNQFARKITLLNNILTHEWVLSGTTLYIPFVRHNPTLGAYTTIKLQASKTGTTSSYPISVRVFKSDGTPQDVDVCGGTLKAGDICEIKGEDLITAAGKDQTFAIINVDKISEDSITCYAVYKFGQEYRRIPCKVKGGNIVE